MTKQPWTDNPIETLSNNIYAVMDSRRITAKQIASKDLTANQISYIKNGYGQDVCLIQIYKLCQHLWIHPVDLLQGNLEKEWVNHNHIDDNMISSFAKCIREGKITAINDKEVTQSYIFYHSDYFNLYDIYRLENPRNNNNLSNRKRMTLYDLIHYADVFHVSPETVLDELVQYIHNR